VNAELREIKKKIFGMIRTGQRMDSNEAEDAKIN
jgi:hypothetical protein